MELPLRSKVAMFPLVPSAAKGRKAACAAALPLLWMKASRLASPSTWFSAKLLVRWMPRLPTYETSSRLFFHNSRSTVRFHCHVLGSLASSVIAALGAPFEVEQLTQESIGFAGSASSVRSPFRLALNGGLPAGGKYGDTRSRWKN